MNISGFISPPYSRFIHHRHSSINRSSMLSQITKRTLQGSMRSFSTARVAFAEQGKDSFSEKEKAAENVYIKKHEAEQLKALRERLDKQKETIDKLEDEINKMKK